MKSVAILGGGISGLALAYFLKKKYHNHLHISLFEKSNRMGGWIRTIHSKGYQFELGPRNLRAQGKGIETLSLALELGLEENLIFASLPSQRRYLLKEGKLDPIPKSIFELLFTKSGRLIVKALFSDLFARKGSHEEESIEVFFSRRFGRDFTRQYVDPFVTGIFGGKANELSLKACLSRFSDLEKKYPSLVLGLLFNKEKQDVTLENDLLTKTRKNALFSFDKGVEMLPKTLYEAIQKKVDCHLNSSIATIERKDCHFFLKTKEGAVFKKDYVFSTLPLFENRSFLPSHHKDLINSKAFDTSYASFVLICLGWKKNVLKAEGFGYLVPDTEKNESVLGAVFDSIAFPSQNSGPEETRITFMLGGMRQPNLLNLDQKELLSIAKKALKNHLGIDEPFEESLIFRAKEAIAQYQLGHLDRIHELQEKIANHFPGFIFSGSGIGGVSINDCISNAKKLSESLEM